MRQLKTFTRDRSKFMEWDDKLLNALDQVNPGYRKAINDFNNKLETMDGV